jgi:xanthine/CO dehydrogenase XdhC/CoxF family maturation factor
MIIVPAASARRAPLDATSIGAPSELAIFGTGHDTEPLAQLATMLASAVTIVDIRAANPDRR